MRSTITIKTKYLLLAVVLFLLLFGLLQYFFFIKKLDTAKITNITNAGKPKFPTLIVGGYPVNHSKWPFTVAIYPRGDLNKSLVDYPTGVNTVQYKHDLQDAFVCSGVLIDKYWVLTAAHCAFGWSKRSLGVAIGFNTLVELNDEKKNQFINVEKVIIHEGYDDTAYSPKNDLALFKLEESAFDIFKPISLNESDLVKEKLPVYTMGYGKTEIGVNGTLNEVILSTISNSRANKKFWYRGDVLPSMLVLGFPLGGESTCNGDSGGPSVIYDSAKKKYLLVGVTSWSIKGKDGECGVPFKPAVVTRISSFYNWILSQIKPALLSPNFVGVEYSTPQAFTTRLKEFDEDNQCFPTSNIGP